MENYDKPLPFVHKPSTLTTTEWRACFPALLIILSVVLARFVYYLREKGDDGRSFSSEQGASNRPAGTSAKWTGHAVEEPNNAEPATCSNCGDPTELSWFIYGGGKRRVVVRDHMRGKDRCNKHCKKSRGYSVETTVKTCKIRTHDIL